MFKKDTLGFPFPETRPSAMRVPSCEARSLEEMTGNDENGDEVHHRMVVVLGTPSCPRCGADNSAGDGCGSCGLGYVDEPYLGPVPGRSCEVDPAGFRAFDPEQTEDLVAPKQDPGDPFEGPGSWDDLVNDLLRGVGITHG